MTTTPLTRIAALGTFITAIALLIALLASAMFSAFQRPASQRPDPLSLAPEPPVPEILAPPMIDYTRKWAMLGTTGFFNFTDSEWALIAARWPVSGDPAQPTATLPQGPVTRLDASTLATLIALHPEARRTNRVWFAGEPPSERPVAPASAPTDGPAAQPTP